MAYQRITVNGADAAMNAIVAFLTTNPDLVSVGQNWAVSWMNDTRSTDGRFRVLVKGPGLTASDEVYVCLSTVRDSVTVGETVLSLGGATGPNPNQPTLETQYGATPRPPRMFLDNTLPMELFMVANGRRFIIVVKISTTYQPMYGGLILPYATPNMYTYPLFIGNTCGFGSAGSYQATSWRNSARGGNSAFMRAVCVYSTGSNFCDPSGALLLPTGQWVQVDSEIGTNQSPFSDKISMGPHAQPVNMIDGRQVNTQTFGSYATTYGIGFQSVMTYTIDCLGGGIVTAPFTLFFTRYNGAYDPITYGILDGMECVMNRDAAAETTFVRDGVTYMIFPNVMRTDIGQYWALALE